MAAAAPAAGESLSHQAAEDSGGTESVSTAAAGKQQDGIERFVNPTACFSHKPYESRAGSGGLQMPFEDLAAFFEALPELGGHDQLRATAFAEGPACAHVLRLFAAAARAWGRLRAANAVHVEVLVFVALENPPVSS